jgi:putative transposase
MDAIFWYLRVGSQWRNLSECFPPWQSVYYYFARWQKDGVLEKLNCSLNQLLREQMGKAPTSSQAIIDTQSVKTGPVISEDKSIDGNKKNNGRKRHLLTDTVGLIWAVVVYAANKYDGMMAEKVVAPLQGYLDRVQKILADQAYKKTFTPWNNSRQYSQIKLDDKQ